MDAISLDTIRACLEGVIPATVATCSEDGIPNATYVSQMQYVDSRHVALSFQFFNRTRQNVLSNPHVTALVIDPQTAAGYRLALLYLRTETDGALFQRMKAKLAGIASHSGMADVFRLRGSDVYRVLAIERIPGPSIAAPPLRRNLLSALRAASVRLAECTDVDSICDQALAALSEEFGIEQALLLMADEPRDRLYTVASRGYAATGVGSEIAYGDGVIGVAARFRTPIRINHFTADYGYGRAARGEAVAQSLPLEAQIPFPGLPEPHSQLAVPVCAGDRLMAVLCVESPQDLRFGYDDEDALVTLAAQLGLALRAAQCEAESAATDAAPEITTELPVGRSAEVRHFATDDSVFLDSDYLIKGVPGAILWKLLRTWQGSGRTSFTNRELRLAATELGLPEVSDNLEARLLLLRRRLAERCPDLAIERTGRGQFRLHVRRALELVDVPD